MIIKPTVKLNVTRIRPIYKQEFSPLRVEWLYNVAEAIIGGSKLTIVDRYGILERGKQIATIEEMNKEELEKLKSIPQTHSWLKPDMKIYKVEIPVDLKQYFSECDWSEKLKLWLTEGLEKDKRIINCVKSITVPLYGDPLELQPLNAHSIWCTNTGTGKSFFAYLWGSEPIIDANTAGLLGSYAESSRGVEVQKGELEGYGFPILLDEVNTIEKPLIPKLLTYMESGKVKRGLKYPIEVEGTKTIIFTANPESNNLISAFASLLKIIASVEHPERVGRRIGFVLIGNDYKEVKGEQDSSVREEVMLVLKSAFIAYRKDVCRIIKASDNWIKKRDEDIEKEVMDYSKSCPNEVVSRFLKGHSLSITRKLKTSAVRYLILEHLDQLPNPDLSNKDEVYSRLFEINKDSYEKLSVKIEMDEDRKATAKKLRDKGLSIRDIARIFGVSHETVRKWLKSS